MLAFSLSSLLVGATLTSAAYVRPVAPRAEASAVVSNTCSAGTTTHSCPSGWYANDDDSFPNGDPSVFDGRSYKTCGETPAAVTSFTYCYYMVDQDWIAYERQPDGTTVTGADAYSDPGCPLQGATSITCNPTTGAGTSYACSDPVVVYNCPSGYSATGTYTARGSLSSGQDLICTSGSTSCYYYGDSGEVDTLSTGHSSGGSCATQLAQTGTCSNSVLQRRSGKPTSPAWLTSRQAVIKKGSSKSVVVTRKRTVWSQKK